MPITGSLGAISYSRIGDALTGEYWSIQVLNSNQDIRGAVFDSSTQIHAIGLSNTTGNTAQLLRFVGNNNPVLTHARTYANFEVTGIQYFGANIRFGGGRLSNRGWLNTSNANLVTVGTQNQISPSPTYAGGTEYYFRENDTYYPPFIDNFLPVVNVGVTLAQSVSGVAGGSYNPLFISQNSLGNTTVGLQRNFTNVTITSTRTGNSPFNELWCRLFQANGNVSVPFRLTSLDTDNAGNNLVGMYYGNTGYLVKLDNSGNILYQKQFNNLKIQNIQCEANNVYVAGTDNGNLIIGKVDDSANIIFFNSINLSNSTFSSNNCNLNIYGNAMYIAMNKTSTNSLIYTKLPKDGNIIGNGTYYFNNFDVLTYSNYIPNISNASITNSTVSYGEINLASGNVTTAGTGNTLVTGQVTKSLLN
jgi:hypothetical protein